MTIGVVDRISKKDGVSKAGKPYVKYGIMISNAWYNAGFKEPTVAKGDEVEFEFNENQWGKELTSIHKTGNTSAAAPAQQTSSVDPVWSVFKVDMPKDRAIIRQNALGHATNVVLSNSHAAAGDLDVVSNEVVRIARLFESYSTGEMDVEAAKELV